MNLPTQNKILNLVSQYSILKPIDLKRLCKEMIYIVKNRDTDIFLSMPNSAENPSPMSHPQPTRHIRLESTTQHRSRPTPSNLNLVVFLFDLKVLNGGGEIHPQNLRQSMKYRKHKANFLKNICKLPTFYNVYGERKKWGGGGRGH